MIRKLLRFIRNLFFFLLIIVLLVAIAVGIFIYTFDLNRFKDTTEQKLSIVLGRPVTIESMHTKLSLVPTITINGFKILNNDPFKDKAPLVSIQKMDAELELAPLLSYNINIHKVSLDKADITLLKNAETNNWTIKSASSDSSNTTEKKATEPNAKINLQKNLRLNVINIKQLTLAYDDGKQKQDLTINNLEIKQLHTVKGEVIYNKQNFTINLNAASIFDFLNQTPNFPIDLKIQSRLANISLNGKIGDFKTFSGLQAIFSIKTTNLKSFLNFFDINNALIPSQSSSFQIQAAGNLEKLEIKQLTFDIDSPKSFSFTGTGTLQKIQKDPTVNLTFKTLLSSEKLSDLWSIQSFTASGDLNASSSRLVSQKIVIDANRSDATLSFKVQKEAQKYDATINFVSDFLDIYDLWKKKNISKTATLSAPSSSEQQDITIPWDLLKKLDVAANINIRHLQTSDWVSDPIGISSNSTLKNGILAIPFDITALKGKLSGSVEAKENTKSVSFNGRGLGLNLNGVRALQKEIKDVVADLNVTLNAKGLTLQDIIKSTQGRIVLQTSQGQIINKWLADLPKVLNIKKKQTITHTSSDDKMLITCGAANISINQGVIQAKNLLAIETNMINLLLGGSINLNKKTMNIALYPSLPEGEKSNEILSISRFIRISGPFDKLTPKVDTTQVATDLVKAGVNKLLGTDKKAEEHEKEYVKGHLCQDVLGRNAITVEQNSTTKKSSSKQPAKSKQTTTQTKGNEKKPFKEQLINSLFQAFEAK